MTMKEGARVRWQSQSQGYQAIKEGVIVSVIPSGRTPDKTVFPSLHTGAGVGMARDHDSYVVKAHRLDRRGMPQGGEAIYWPRANKLQAIE